MKTFGKNGKCNIVSSKLTKVLKSVTDLPESLDSDAFPRFNESFLKQIFLLMLVIFGNVAK